MLLYSGFVAWLLSNRNRQMSEGCAGAWSGVSGMAKATAQQAAGDCIDHQPSVHGFIKPHLCLNDNTPERVVRAK